MDDQLSTLSSILDGLTDSQSEAAQVAERIAARFLIQRIKPETGRAHVDILNPPFCPVCGRLMD